MLEDLSWLGLDWDHGPNVEGPHSPYVQTQRLPLYQHTLDRLRRLELVYPCTCTRKEIEQAASAPHAEDEGPTYPGLCAFRRAEDAASLDERPYSWRFRVRPGFVRWRDLIRGEQAIDPAALGGDFIVARSNGTFSYQLAVVHDDATMGVNQVVRGDDLVPSTPRQILLHQALGWNPPDFAHLPLVLGSDGRRLAKRDGSVKLATYREQGVDPHRVIGLLACSLGWSSSVITSRPADWLDAFDFATLPRQPWSLDTEWTGEVHPK